MEDLIYWIWLSISCAVGTESFKKLFEKYQSAKTIYELDDHEIASVITSKAKDYERLINKDLDYSRKILDFCTNKKVGIVYYSQKEYPNSLREIKNPPVLLYYRGKLPDFDSLFMISVVGTRRLTNYGLINAFNISYDLSCAGATIVSGMAVGVDGVAHAGALSASKPTIAVLGSGIDICYPAEHLSLAKEIVKDGCILTEYPPSTKPEKYNFPQRNRIISALSYATVVIEGGERSGAMITARFAKEQSKTVYALPGNVDNKKSAACNLLIQNGAKLCISADDIISDFDKTHPGKLNPFKLQINNKINIHNKLCEYKVSCVTPGDNIFKPGKNMKNTNKPAANAVDLTKNQTVTDNSDKLPETFDPKIIALYKKIPLMGDCTVDSLLDSEMNLSFVMKGLLKLEISRFIVMLPGDRVKRNL